jgi:hypothetical protein
MGHALASRHKYLKRRPSGPRTPTSNARLASWRRRELTVLYGSARDALPKGAQECGWDATEPPR